MSDKLLKQIKEEERSDKISNFFKKNISTIKKLAIAAIIILILGVIFWIWQNHQEEKYSSILHKSLIEEELNNLDKAKQELQNIINAKLAPSGAKSVAHLRYAGFLLQENKYDKALKAYQEISNSVTYDDFIQDLANLLAIKILVNEQNLNPEENLGKIKKLVNKNKDLRPYALEQLAIYYINHNKKQEARRSLEEIIHDQKASKTLKLRVQELIKVI